jgi:hypothetical protein
MDSLINKKDVSQYENTKIESTKDILIFFVFSTFRAFVIAFSFTPINAWGFYLRISK